jgi:hypothetical protein
MKEWHVKHAEQTLVKFVIGLSEDASYWKKEWTRNIVVSVKYPKE